jgi:aminoglycoside phosphotransferase (APT) family kinase protein
VTPAVDLVGLPARPVRRWFGRNLPEADVSGRWAPEIIAGGLSNITYRLPLASGTLILRRPPVGHLLPRAHDVAREYRVLAALAGSPVPVPEPLGFCADPDVIGAPFTGTTRATTSARGYRWRPGSPPGPVSPPRPSSLPAMPTSAAGNCATSAFTWPLAR